MKISVGEFDPDVPRDHKGSFEQLLLKKHQTPMSDHIEQKILKSYHLISGNVFLKEGLIKPLSYDGYFYIKYPVQDFWESGETIVFIL